MKIAPQCYQHCGALSRTVEEFDMSSIAQEWRESVALCGHVYLRKANTQGRTRKYCDSCRADNPAPVDSLTSICSFEGCDRNVRARGLCNMHYKRLLRSEGKLQSEWDDRRRANYHRRRALKRNLPADVIRPSDVFERDGWKCGICELPVDGALMYPDPFSPSLDHVIPLARGGHHVFENVQLTHLCCNLQKGAD